MSLLGAKELTGEDDGAQEARGSGSDDRDTDRTTEAGLRRRLDHARRARGDDAASPAATGAPAGETRSLTSARGRADLHRLDEPETVEEFARAKRVVDREDSEPRQRNAGEEGQPSS